MVNGENNNDKSPITLTPLTNVFPTFSETFNSSNGQGQQGPNGHSAHPPHPHLPKFQSSLHSSSSFHQELQGLVHHQDNSISNGGPSPLPSFHTLSGNRGYALNNPGGGGGGPSLQIHPHSNLNHIHHHNPHNPHHPQFALTEDRHIQIFPGGQVHLGSGQFGHLIATTTMGGQNGHYGNGQNGYNGMITTAAPTQSPHALPTSTSIQLQELLPVPPMSMSLHAAGILGHPSAAGLLSSPTGGGGINNGNNNGLQNSKLLPSTDGNIPGLNSMLHSNLHHNEQHLQMQQVNPSPHFKYLEQHEAQVMQQHHHPHPHHPLEGHLIAVKLPNPNSNFLNDGSSSMGGIGAINPNMLHIHHSPHQQPSQHPHQLNGNGHHINGNGQIQIQSHLLHSPQSNGHHQIITKLDQTLCSPMSNSNHSNGGGGGPGGHNGNSRNGTPKRNGSMGGGRKRKTGGNGINGGMMDPHQFGGLLMDHHENDQLNDAQVSSVSSTDSLSEYKRLGGGGSNGGNGIGGMNGGNGQHHMGGNGMEDGLDKPVKKKRKRCGECGGCQRKDNCGDCAPCRNDKSHQICKVRRCDKLTEKKTNMKGKGGRKSSLMSEGVSMA